MIQDKVEFVREQICKRESFSLPQDVSEPPEWLDGSRPNPELEAEGLRLLRENKVAVLMVAGGLSTRMAIKEHRGNLPVGPVTGRTIFQLQGEKVAAMRERYSPRLLWLVLTSPEVHEIVVASFKRAAYFGFPPENVYFFQQKSFPVLDSEGNPVVLHDGRYLEAPCGHGGVFEALQNSGLLVHLHDEAIEHLFFFQYPNVLEHVFDPVMLGYHHIRDFDVTVKAVTNYSPDEPLGRCVTIDKCVKIIEYHYLKEGSLLGSFWHKTPASIGTYMWRISFLMRCVEMRASLPFHVLPHRSSIQFPKPLLKLEQFAFDLMSYSPNNGVVVVARDEEYAPVKEKKGRYSLEAGRAALARLYSNWLVKAGATLPVGDRECIVEISPRFALNYKELKSKISSGLLIQPGMVL